MILCVLEVVGKEKSAEVKIKAETVIETEVVDKTYTCCEVVIVSVAPSVTTVVGCPFGNCLPVVTHTCIEDTVVETVSTIAAPPICEVQHSLKMKTELVALVFLKLNVAVTEIAVVADTALISEALDLSEVETGTKTDDG